MIFNVLEFEQINVCMYVYHLATDFFLPSMDGIKNRLNAIIFRP